MTKATHPPELRIRNVQRFWLITHFVAFVLGMGIAVLLNRTLTPHVFWVPWLGLAWGLVFLVHVIVFAVVTLATLGQHNPT
jgi:hypothetical protein